MPTVEKRNIIGISGSEISLACEITASTGSVILWKKDGRVLFAGDLRVRRNSRFNVMNDYLVIENANIEDTGEYVCETERENGKLETFSSNLQVQNPPKAEIPIGSQLTVKAGTSLSVTCSGSGVPTPEVRWKRGDIVLSVGNGVAELVLDSVTRVDIGVFMCEAFNGVGDDDVKTLELDVLFAPEIELLQPEISFQPKCGMEVQCLVHSSSSPTVQWFNNDLLLQPKDGVTMWSLDNHHVLQIHSCDQKILGQFTCKAISVLGEDNMSVIITEQFVENRIVQELEAEEKTNNVRRNVDQHHALPFVSSNVAKSSYSFLVCIVLALAIFL